jgi:hypothetical protein
MSIRKFYIITIVNLILCLINLQSQIRVVVCKQLFYSDNNANINSINNVNYNEIEAGIPSFSIEQEEDGEENDSSYLVEEHGQHNTGILSNSLDKDVEITVDSIPITKRINASPTSQTTTFRTTPPKTTTQLQTTLLTTNNSINLNPYKRVCVYPNWAIIRESHVGRILPEDIDPHLCTHIHYAYANIDIRTFQMMPSLSQDVKSGLHGEVIIIFIRVLQLIF